MRRFEQLISDMQSSCSVIEGGVASSSLSLSSSDLASRAGSMVQQPGELRSSDAEISSSHLTSSCSSIYGVETRGILEWRWDLGTISSHALYWHCIQLSVRFLPPMIFVGSELMYAINNCGSHSLTRSAFILCFLPRFFRLFHTVRSIHTMDCDYAPRWSCHAQPPRLLRLYSPWLMKQGWSILIYNEAACRHVDIVYGID